MNPNKKSAFSIIELLVAIAIIGILSGVVLVSVNSARQKSRIAAAKSQARNLYNALVMMETDTGEWPGHQVPMEINSSGTNEICSDGCAFGINDPRAGLTATDGTYSGWAGPYVNSIPKDPWGHDYFFDTDYAVGGRTAVVIGSYGPNGVGNNQYDSDDVFLLSFRNKLKAIVIKGKTLRESFPEGFWFGLELKG